MISKLLTQPAYPFLQLHHPAGIGLFLDRSVILITTITSFSLQVSGSGTVGVGNAPGNTYLNGSAYQSGLPLDNTQLAFQLIYRARWLTESLFKQGMAWIGWLVAAVFLFILPGWGLLVGLLDKKEGGDLAKLEQVGLA